MHFLSLPRTLRLDFPARLRGNVWGMIDLEISREFFSPFFRPPIVRAVRKKKENPRGEKRKYVKGELFFGIIKAIFRYRVSTVWKGSTGVPFPILELSSPENCPSSWLQFPDTLFRYFENFFETVTERGNAVPRNWTFSPLNTFVLEHVRFVFLEESRSFDGADPDLFVNASLLDTNIRFIEYYLGGRGRIYTDDFQWIFFSPYLSGQPDFDALVKFRHRNTRWISAKNRLADKRLFTITTTVFGF